MNPFNCHVLSVINSLIRLTVKIEIELVFHLSKGSRNNSSNINVMVFCFIYALDS